MHVAGAPGGRPGGRPRPRASLVAAAGVSTPSENAERGRGVVPPAAPAPLQTLAPPVPGLCDGRRAGTASVLAALARMSADVDTASAKHVASLFATLEDALRSFSLHKALHACDQILAVAPADEDALRAKVAVCIHSERFDAALALLDAHSDLAARLPFEKAYCLYRASRLKEALELLRDAEAAIPPEHAAGALQLRAQLQYRAGAFDDCIRTYELAFEVRRRPRLAISPQRADLAFCPRFGRPASSPPPRLVQT